MAFQWLVDWLTGNMVLVDVPMTAGGTPPTHGASLLLETGDYLLLETGDTLLLE